MNYKETEVTGQQWTRCFDVRCRNPYEGVKEIEFSEEVAINLGDKVITQPTGSRITEQFTDHDEVFALLHPTTGDALGTATYGQFYAMVHSLYMHLADKRDAANAPPLPTVPEPEPEQL